jgi:hypothetical protein
MKKLILVLITLATLFGEKIIVTNFPALMMFQGATTVLEVEVHYLPESKDWGYIYELSEEGISVSYGLLWDATDIPILIKALSNFISFASKNPEWDPTLVKTMGSGTVYPSFTVRNVTFGNKVSLGYNVVAASYYTEYCIEFFVPTVYYQNITTEVWTDDTVAVPSIFLTRQNARVFLKVLTGPRPKATGVKAMIETF